MPPRALLLLSILSLAACSDEGPVKADVTLFDGGAPRDAGATPDAAEDAGDRPDGNLPDTGLPDGDLPDTSLPDGDLPDTGLPDGDVPDTGLPDGDIPDGDLPDADPGDTGDRDAMPDTGPVDTGTPDAGTPDTGVLPDGGFIPTYAQTNIDDTFFHGQAATTVDIEGDGDLDVIASISLDDTVRLYLNGGNGSSWTPVDVAQPGSIVAMHAVADDLDGDGDLDIVAAGLFDRAFGFASPGEVVWYRNDNGLWTERPITGLTFWGPRHVATGDLTGDGLPDLVVGALQTFDQNGFERGHGVHWFRNTGGNFAGPVAADMTLLNVEVVIVQDVDQNGVDDVIASGGMSNEVVWYENLRNPGTVDANPTFVRHTITGLVQASGLALVQMDADPALELFATGSNGSGGTIVWLDAPANPRNPWTPNTVTANFGGTDTVRVSAADINLDGRPDVAVSSFNANSLRVYLNDASLGWLAQPVLEPFTGVTYVSTGDVDGDTIPDLITSTYANNPNFDRIDWWRTQP